MKRLVLAILVGITLAVAAAGVWISRRPAGPAGIIEASGRVEGDQAAVGPKVGGKIVQLAVREGQQVQGGQVIAELASEQVQAQLEQAQHAVHTARERLAEAQARMVSARGQAEASATIARQAARESPARIGESEAALGAARAGLAQAEAELERASRDYARYRELFAKELISAQQLDQARAAAETARASVEAARKQVAQAEQAIEVARTSAVGAEARQQEARVAADRIAEARAAADSARAQLESAEAGVTLARSNLEDMRVVAPFWGTVLKRLVEPGEVVAAGTPLVTVVDLSRLYAKVYVVEADLGKIKLGERARVSSDSVPGRFFEASVSEIAQQAEFTPRDVHMKEERAKLVYAVKLALENPQGILKPGMAVDALVRWDPQAPWPERRG